MGCLNECLARRTGEGASRAADPEEVAPVRMTKVVLASAHRDHDTINNTDDNLAAFCQRCHRNHDWPKHQRRRWRTLFRRRALGDLFRCPYT